MSITFNTIALNILTPGQYIEFDNSRGVQGLPVVPHKILVIAPRLASGTVAALTPTRIRSVAEGELACGRGSLGAAMISAAKTANPYTELWMIGVSANAAGVAASGTLTVTGPATAAGTIALYIAGQRVDVSIAAADTAEEIAAAIVAAIATDTSLPITAATGVDPNEHVVTVIAKYKGETGNAIDLRLNYNSGENLPAGVAIAIVPMATGATNPDMATTLAALADVQYHTIITPFTDPASLTSLEALLLERWGGMVQTEGHAFGAVSGTHSEISTAVDIRNSPFLTLMGTQKSPSPPWLFAAVLGALDAEQAEDPSNCNRPRQTLWMRGILASKEADRYTRTERNTHLADGAATFVVDDGGLVRVERLVTTYKTANGVPDTSYQDVEIMRALAYLRFSTRERIALRFPRHKLANDPFEIPPGQPIATPRSIRDELIALFQDWQGVGLVENIEQFKRDLLVEIDEADVNRVNAIIPPDVINGFRVFAGSIQFRL